MLEVEIQIFRDGWKGSAIYLKEEIFSSILSENDNVQNELSKLQDKKENPKKFSFKVPN